MDQIVRKVLQFDRFALDLTRGCLRIGDRDIDLRPKTFEMLRLLAENAGRLVSKDELYAVVWPGVVVSDDSLVQCIRELRQALGDSEHRLIKTVSRRGYLFDAVVVEQERSIAAIVAKPDEAVAADRLRFGPVTFLRAHGVAVGAVALLLMLTAVGMSLWSTRLPAVAAPDRRFSVVVLPFQNLGGDHEQQYFVDAVTEGVTVGVSRLPGKVIASGTAFTYSGKPVDARQIGRELDVRYVIEGAVAFSGEDGKVTARLIEAETATQLWTETFDLDRGNLAALREDVTARLASVLRLELVVAQGARSLRERPHNPDAVDYSIRGHTMLLRGPNRDLLKARRLFREALKRDDRLAGAWFGLAATYTRDVRFSPTREDDLREAQAAAERAVSLAPQESLAHVEMGWVHYERKRMDQALAAFEHATKLNANNSFAHASVAAANIMLGYPENALEPLRKAMRLSPRDPSLARWQMFLGVADLHLGRYGGAVDNLTRAAALNPGDSFTNLFLASALALVGRQSDAQVQLAEFMRLHPTFTLGRFKAVDPSDAPEFRVQRARLYEGLRLAGLPE